VYVPHSLTTVYSNDLNFTLLCVAVVDLLTTQAATVNGQDGHELSSARRAKAGSVMPKLTTKPGDDAVTDLYRRAYNFANAQTG
jgi:hypothetical protein